MPGYQTPDPPGTKQQTKYPKEVIPRSLLYPAAPASRQGKTLEAQRALQADRSSGVDAVNQTMNAHGNAMALSPASEQPQQTTLNQLRAQLKDALDCMEREVTHEALARDAELAHKGMFKRSMVFTGAFLTGLYNAGRDMTQLAVGMFNHLNDSSAREDAIQGLHNGDCSAFKHDSDNADAAQKFCDTYQLLYNDKETWQLLADFPERYWNNLHITIKTQMVGVLSFDIVLALMSGSSGAATSVLSKSSHFYRASEILRRITAILKQPDQTAKLEADPLPLITTETNLATDQGVQSPAKPAMSLPTNHGATYHDKTRPYQPKAKIAHPLNRVQTASASDARPQTPTSTGHPLTTDTKPTHADHALDQPNHEPNTSAPQRNLDASAAAEIPVTHPTTDAQFDLRSAPAAEQHTDQETPDSLIVQPSTPPGAMHNPPKLTDKLSMETATVPNGKPSDCISKSRFGGQSIHLATGEQVLEIEDFQLPGPIPLRWKRVYRSSNGLDRGLGFGWSISFLSRLRIDGNQIIWEEGEGRRVRFLKPLPGEFSYQAAEQVWLQRDEKGRYQLTTKDHVCYRFGGHGQIKRLVQISDNNGNAQALEYNLAGQLARLRDSAGRWFQLNRDQEGRICSVSLCDNDGNPLKPPLVKYHYNENGDLVEATDRAEQCQRYQYDNHVMTQHTTKGGFTYNYQWDRLDIHGKCIHASGENGVYACSFEYDEAQRITRVTNGLGAVTELLFNEQNKVIKEVDGEGGIIRNDYDAAGNLIRCIDPEGHNTRYEYNHTGKLTHMIDPQGRITQIDYDEFDRPTRLTDAAGQQWFKHYDNRGNLVQTEDPLGNVTRYTYYNNGSLKSIANALGHKQTLYWNTRGDLVQLGESGGAASYFQYDTFGNLTQSTDALGHSNHYGYDTLNRLVFIRQADGSEIKLAYNVDGELVRYVDSAGRTTEYEYDGLSQPKLRRDTAGQTMHFEYDSERNLTSITNENGEKYILGYDQNQRIVKEIGFDGRQQQYQYDRSGHLIGHTDAGEKHTDFRRDPLGRLLQKKTSDGETTHYRYDALGRLTMALNPHAKLAFEYDPAGNLTSESQNRYQIRYAYDAIGQQKQILLPTGEKIEYEYDSNGQFSLLKIANQPVVQLKYDKRGLETNRRSGAVLATCEYDPAGRLTKQQAKRGEHTILGRQYSYDVAGNLRLINDIKQGTRLFRYDPLDRLEGVRGPITERFTFDPAGNLMDTQVQRQLGAVRGGRTLKFLDYQFDYDVTGNILRERNNTSTTLYQYNANNQMIRAQKDGQLVAFGYDPLGRRIIKQSKTAKTQYVWSKDVLLLEQTGNQKITYVYEPDSFKPVCQLTLGQLYFYHNDHMGTPLVLTDTDGVTVWAANYQSHGGIARYETETISNPIRFQGQYHDTETGLYYNRNRYYHPSIGRYTAADPVGLTGGYNLYTYATNTTGWVDPLGLRATAGKTFAQPKILANGGAYLAERQLPAAYTHAVMSKSTMLLGHFEPRDARKCANQGSGAWTAESLQQGLSMANHCDYGPFHVQYNPLKSQLVANHRQLLESKSKIEKSATGSKFLTANPVMFGARAPAEPSENH